MLRLCRGVSDMDHVRLGIERQRTGDIDDPVGGHAGRVGGQGLARPGREDGLHGHYRSPFVVSVGLMLARKAVQNSATDEVQPKKFSML